MKKILLIIIIVSGLLPRINQKGQLVIGNNTAMVYGQQNEDPGNPDCGKWGGCEEIPPPDLDPIDGGGGVVPPNDPTDPTPPGDGDPGYWDDENDPNDPGMGDDWGYPGYDFDPSDLLDLDDANSDANSGPTVAPKPKCYILFENNPTKFYDGSTMSFAIQSGKTIKLTVADENGVLVPADYVWDINNTPRCNNVDNCSCDLSNKGTYKVKIYDKSNHKVIQISVIVYSKPVVNFHRHKNYDSKYGFDEVGNKYPVLSSDYEIIQIDGTNYIVPWMSLLDGGQNIAKVKVSPMLNSSAKDDPAFKVTFQPTTNKIKINGMPSIEMDYNGLKTLTEIDITSNELDPDISLRKQEAIEVKNNLGEVIGKLNISCQKPIEKNVVFVYVKTGSSYRTDITPTEALNNLNTYSHNQIFKKFNQVTQNSQGDIYPTQMDLSSVSNISSLVNSSQTGIDYLVQEYKKLSYVNDPLKKVDLDAINPNPTAADDPISNVKTRFIFITDFSIQEIDPNDGSTGILAGRCRALGDCYLFITANGTYKTIIHEMGHALNLTHIFQALQIKKYTTSNFMDYVEEYKPDERDMFYKFQWRLSYK